MTTWMTCGLTLVAALVVFPCVVLFVECLFASLPWRDREFDGADARPRVGVLVPAHNEEAVIAATLDSIAAQLRAGDRLLVIADNCTDATASVAAERGAEVIARNDLVRRGKGYALQAGLEHFEQDPPAIVIVIDADCRLEPRCVDALTIQVAATSRPVQACNLSLPPRNPRPTDVVSSLAVLVKNCVRPLGMARMGFPCFLTGTGSAFPWHALRMHSFAGANIVEDMQLGVELSLAGLSPTFCRTAVLTSLLPEIPSAVVSQRRRWEHGHLQTLLTQLPRLLAGFVRSGRTDLAATMVDLSVPPLSLLVLFTGAALGIALVASNYGASSAPAIAIASGLVLLSVSIVLAWYRFARDFVPFRALASIPLYIIRKIPLYLTFVVRRERSWVRTSRNVREKTPVD